jgi:rare lipoprotein A (peptidoglycan hydrolase)
VDRAVAAYETARAKSAEIDSRVNTARLELDRAVTAEKQCQDRLRIRASAIYRTTNDSPLLLLLGASTIQDLAARLDLLERLARTDVENILALKAARAEAKETATEMLELQSEGARALDALADEAAAAKKQLSTSEAALAAYKARTAASAKAAAARDATPQLSGSGAWKTAVASHYSRNFTGRSASGETIGPYSMIVAHKTLPFGTLIEFEYGGKRAVARVADRGPYTKGRTFDLGPGVVRVLDFSGVHEVRYRIITK